MLFRLNLADRRYSILYKLCYFGQHCRNWLIVILTATRRGCNRRSHGAVLRAHAKTAGRGRVRMGRWRSDATAGVDLTEAHRRLLADKTLQFDFGQAPPPPKPPPDWLVRAARGHRAGMKYVFWGLVILAALLILAFLVREVIKVRWQGRVGKAGAAAPAAAAWRPKAARARAVAGRGRRPGRRGPFRRGRPPSVAALHPGRRGPPAPHHPAGADQPRHRPPRGHAASAEGSLRPHRRRWSRRACSAAGRWGPTGSPNAARAYEAFAFEGAWA